MAERSILEVTTPAAATQLVSVLALKLELDLMDESEDAYLSRIARAASDAIHKAVGRVLVQQTYRQTFQLLPVDARFVSRRPEALMLDAWPVGTISSLVGDGQALVAGTDYELSPQNGMVYRLLSGLPAQWDDNKVVVEFTAGFASGAIPSDLEQIAIDLCTHFRSLKGRDRTLRRERVGNILDQTFVDPAATGAAGLPPDLLDRLLSAYGSPVFA